MENILDLLYEYSKRRMLFGPLAVNLIVKILIKINDLDIENVKIDDGIHIINLNDVTFGRFNYDKITIHYSALIKYLKLRLHETDFNNEKKLLISDKYFRDNLYILYIIFHEIEHAIDLKNYINNEDTLRKKLHEIELGYMTNIGYNNNITYLHDYYFGDRRTIFSDVINILYFGKESKLYDKNYDISFSERVADITACKKLLLLIDEIKDDIKTVYKLQEDLLYDFQMENYYTDETSPTIEFFTNLGLISEFNKLDTENLDLETRIDYGLKLTKKELETSMDRYKYMF